jgi:hypothetical protein
MGLGYWVVGFMAIIVYTTKFKNGQYPLKKPIFQHSTIPLFHE